MVRARNAHLSSQWFADQGFVVVVVDGRGTPGRGPAWERAVWGDLASPVLEDQVDALQALAARDERLDLTRVGIRGWSFGGYLAALAVLRRPDVFHAAVAGAPVTDWRLYDTHYTERYLGHPDEHPAQLPAHQPRRRCPPAHPAAAADPRPRRRQRRGRPHVPPLRRVARPRPAPPGAASLRRHPHDPQETVAENLLLLQLAFLRDALRLGPGRKRR